MSICRVRGRNRRPRQAELLRARSQELMFAPDATQELLLRLFARSRPWQPPWSEFAEAV